MKPKIINTFFFFLGDVVTKELPFFIISTLLMSIPAGYTLGIETNTYSFTAFFSALAQSIPIAFGCCLVVRYISIYIEYFLLFIFIILFAIETFAFLQFNQRMSPLIMSLILQTDWNEIRNFFVTFVFNLTGMMGLAIFVIITLTYISLSKKWKKTKRSFNYFIGVVLLAVTLYSFYITYNTAIAMESNSSFNSVYQFAYSFYQVNKHKGSVDDIFEANRKIIITKVPRESPVIICVIGESFIKRHSNLYGYTLNTNPFLQTERDKGNLFVFNDVVTPFPSTNANMEMIFSIKSSNDSTIWADQPLFPAVFKKAGFKVAFLDFQFTRSMSGYMFDYHCSYFLNPSRIHEQCFDYRNDSIFQHDGDGLDTYIKRLFHGSKSLNIIHLQGQHIPTNVHFPQKTQWQRFNKDSIKRHDLDENQRSIIANYDNCTFYNDYVMKRIIGEFKNEDAVVVYFSDHGEQLFDDWRKEYGRTFGVLSKERIKSVFEIPFMIWVSDSFKTNHPSLIKDISEAVNRPFSNDDVPFILFNLAALQ